MYIREIVTEIGSKRGITDLSKENPAQENPGPDRIPRLNKDSVNNWKEIIIAETGVIAIIAAIIRTGPDLREEEQPEEGEVNSTETA